MSKVEGGVIVIVMRKTLNFTFSTVVDPKEATTLRSNSPSFPTVFCSILTLILFGVVVSYVIPGGSAVPSSLRRFNVTAYPAGISVL